MRVISLTRLVDDEAGHEREMEPVRLDRNAGHFTDTAH